MTTETTVIDPAPGVKATLLVAPCGCSFRGRFYATSGCTVLDDDATGSQRMRHAMRVEKNARPVREPEDWDCGSGQCDPNTGCPACSDEDRPWVARS